MFPQLIAGPIVRYSDIAPELRSRTHTRFGRGGRDAALRAGAGKEDPVCQSAWRAGVRRSAPRRSSQCCISGWARPRSRCRSITIFPATAIWPSASAASSASTFRKTSAIPTVAGEHHGILAAVAYFPWQLVPGLSLYPAWRQPEGERTAAAEHSSRLAGDRPVARGGLDIRSVGTSVCGAADGEKSCFCCAGCKKLRVLDHIYVLLFVTLGFVLFDADSVRSAWPRLSARCSAAGDCRSPGRRACTRSEAARCCS